MRKSSLYYPIATFILLTMITVIPVNAAEEEREYVGSWEVTEGCKIGCCCPRNNSIFNITRKNTTHVLVEADFPTSVMCTKHGWVDKALWPIHKDSFNTDGNFRATNDDNDVVYAVIVHKDGSEYYTLFGLTFDDEHKYCNFAALDIATKSYFWWYVLGFVVAAVIGCCVYRRI